MKTYCDEFSHIFILTWFSQYTHTINQYEKNPNISDHNHKLLSKFDIEGVRVGVLEDSASYLFATEYTCDIKYSGLSGKM